MNLEGWFTVAQLGDEAGVDLWNYRTGDGRSLRAALDYLVPFTSGQATWPHQQIIPIATGDFVPLLRLAAGVWPSGGYGALADRLAAGQPVTR